MALPLSFFIFFWYNEVEGYSNSQEILLAYQ